MCNYWLHRISHCAYAAYPLLDKGYLTIGFRDVLDCEPEFAFKVQNGTINFDEVYSRAYKSIERSRWFLWHFLKDFKQGDVVIVPSWGTFAAFEIIESARPITDLEEQNIKDWNGRQLIVQKEKGLCASGADGGNTLIDLGFYVKVKPLMNYNGSIFAPRDGFMPNNLLKKLKYRGTTLNITDQKADIKDVIARVRDNKRIDFYEKVMQNTIPQIREIMVNAINDSKFEKLVKYYFEKQGARVEIPAKNASNKPEDGDADVIASFDGLGITILVQVKQHENVTDEFAVRQIKEYVEQQTDDGNTLIGWVVSASDSFSEKAIHEANQGRRIRLINGVEIAEMLLNVGFFNINEELS